MLNFLFKPAAIYANLKTNEKGEIEI